MEVASDGGLVNDDRVSTRVNNDVNAVIASTDKGLKRRRSNQVRDVFDSLFTTLVVLMHQLCFLYCFALAFWFP